MIKEPFCLYFYCIACLFGPECLKYFDFWLTSPSFRGLYTLIKVKWEIRKRLNANQPLHQIFLEQLRKHPHKLACIEIETGRKVTYLELNKLMNKYANFFDAEGYKNGDVVSLFMENGIDFFARWLGLSEVSRDSPFGLRKSASFS